MNALADKVQNKECHAQSDMHSITGSHYMFNNHPYISIAVNLVPTGVILLLTYVGMVFE